MPVNFYESYQRGALTPPRLPFLNGKSTTISVGDPVVLTTNATYTTASNPVVRTLLAADIAALYKEGSPIAGLLGFSLNDAVTNSSGVASGQVVYSAKAAVAEPTLALPSYPMGQPPDVNIGYTQLMVAIAQPGVVFQGKLISTSTASNLILGLAGIDLTSGVFTVDPGATTKILNIIGWDPGNTTFVYFEVLPSYCQIETGVFYSTQ